MENQLPEKSYKTSDQEFINLLASQREAKELQDLSQRLIILQQKLQEVKAKTSDAKNQEDISLLRGIILNLKELSVLTPSVELESSLKDISLKIVKVHNQILDQKFGV